MLSYLQSFIDEHFIFIHFIFGSPAPRPFYLGSLGKTCNAYTIFLIPSSNVLTNVTIIPSLFSIFPLGSFMYIPFYSFFFTKYFNDIEENYVGKLSH